MDDAPTAVVVESTSIATEVSKQLLVPRGRCSSKCVAQTRRGSRVVEQIGIVFVVQVEKSATGPRLSLYGFPVGKFRPSGEICYKAVIE